VSHLLQQELGRMCWSVGPLVCWSVGLLVCWSVGPLVCWSVGPLVCWSVGPLFCRSIGSLVHWFVGPLVGGVIIKKTTNKIRLTLSFSQNQIRGLAVCLLFFFLRELPALSKTKLQNEKAVSARDVC
jgi:hypothetical protein